MREILFRGKRTDNGKWVYGSFIPDMLKALEERDILDGFIKPFGRTKEERLMVDVERETVGQFTGLYDKNDKKIFEGDIITGWFNHKKIVGYIFYGGNARFFVQRDGMYGIGLDNSNCWLEIIGNIYDNPELLEGGKINA